MIMNSSWWHEDPELLKATLFMLTAAEDDPTHLLPHLSTPIMPRPDPHLFDNATTTSSMGEEDTKPRKAQQLVKNGRMQRVVNVSRERRRDEARYLRGLVADLEAQLSILQHRREQMLRAHLTDAGEIRSVAVVWEQVATRQVRALRRSHLLNAKFKKMMETQMRIADDLTMAIRKAEEESKKQRDEAGGLISLKRPRDRLAIDISQKVSEEDQLARLERLSLQAEGVFNRCARFSDGRSIRFFDINLVQDSASEAVVDVISSYAVPFAKELVEEMQWQFFLEETAEENGLSWAQHCEPREDAVISVFRVVTTIDTHRVQFDGKSVYKRLHCPQHGHAIMVAHMYSEPQCASKFLSNVALDEDSWIRIVDSHDLGGPKLAYPLTVVQHVRRMYIRFGQQPPAGDQPEMEDARRRVAMLTTFLMEQVEDEVKRGEQAVENMLLDSLGTCRFAQSYCQAE